MNMPFRNIITVKNLKLDNRTYITYNGYIKPNGLW